MNVKKANQRTSFLEQKNKFLLAVGSVLGIAGNYYNYTYFKSDYNAIYSDWEKIQNDFKFSKEKFEKVNKHSLRLNF